MFKDPVCGMMVDEKGATFKTEWGGKTVYFCSAVCLGEFRAHPERYTK